MKLIRSLGILSSVCATSLSVAPICSCNNNSKHKTEIKSENKDLKVQLSNPKDKYGIDKVIKINDNEVYQNVFRFRTNEADTKQGRNLDKVESGAFQGNKQLQHVSYSYEGNDSSVKLETIEKGAFQACENLETIKIPSGCTNIKERAFFRCSKLNYIDLSSFDTTQKLNALTTIGTDAFNGINSTGKVVFNADIVELAKKETTAGDLALAALKSITKKLIVAGVPESYFSADYISSAWDWNVNDSVDTLLSKWESLINLANQGSQVLLASYSGINLIGKTAYIPINNLNHKVRIIGIDHDDLSNGMGKAALTFDFVNLYTETTGVNTTTLWSEQIENYSTSAISTSTTKTTSGFGLPYVLNKFPAIIQNAIKFVDKPTGKGGNLSGSTAKVTELESPTPSQQLFLLSGKEYDLAYGKFGTWNSTKEGSAYEYYSNDGNLTKYSVNSDKYNYCWMRSSHGIDHGYYGAYVLGYSGFSWFDHNDKNSAGVAPGFCIGQTAPTITTTTWEDFITDVNKIYSGEQDIDTFATHYTIWDSTNKKFKQATSADDLVGQQRLVKINGLDHRVRIIGTQHDTIAPGETYAGQKAILTFEFADLITSDNAVVRYQWSSEVKKQIQYSESDVYKSLLESGSIGSLIKSFNNSLWVNIKIVNKDVGYVPEVSTSGAQVTDLVEGGINSKLWLPSWKELGLTAGADTFPAEGTTYSWYTTLTNSVIKTIVNDNTALYYMLRSPYGMYSYPYLGCFDVASSGVRAVTYVSSAIGVAPAFCI